MTQNNDRHEYEKVGVCVSIYQRGKTWWINYQFQGKQTRYSLKTKSQKQARLKALRVESQLQEGEEPKRIRNSSVSEIITAYDQYLESEGRAKKTLSKYRKVFQRVHELAKARKLVDARGIDLGFTDAYRALRKASDAAPKTIHVETVVIKQLVNFAVSRNHLAKNPLDDLQLKRPKLTPQPCWTAEQRDKILKASEATPYQPLYSVLAATGMRIAEAKYLNWEDVDLEHGILHIRQKQIGPKPQDIWKPKTGDQRVVPLSMSTQAILKQIPRQCGWVFTRPRLIDGQVDERPINERRALHHLKKILNELGLPGHLHTFRHTLISHALVSGTPEAVVRQWVGHVDHEILKHYTHIANADSKRYMERLSEKSSTAAEPSDQ